MAYVSLINKNWGNWFHSEHPVFSIKSSRHGVYGKGNKEFPMVEKVEHQCIISYKNKIQGKTQKILSSDKYENSFLSIFLKLGRMMTGVNWIKVDSTDVVTSVYF